MKAKTSNVEKVHVCDIEIGKGVDRQFFSTAIIKQTNKDEIREKMDKTIEEWNKRARNGQKKIMEKVVNYEYPWNY